MNQSSGKLYRQNTQLQQLTYPAAVLRLDSQAPAILGKLCIAACIAMCISACGSKYTRAPATTPTPLLTPDLQSTDVNKEHNVPATPTSVSPAIQPTAIPQADLPRSLPAAVALREQAAIASENTNYARAIGLLERAIRISPNDPETFYALAENHLADHRPQQALELARRALTLNPTLHQQLAIEALEQRCLALL